MFKDLKKHKPARKPNLSIEFAEDKMGILSLMHSRNSSINCPSSPSTESMKNLANTQNKPAAKEKNTLKIPAEKACLADPKRKPNIRSNSFESSKAVLQNLTRCVELSEDTEGTVVRDVVGDDGIIGQDESVRKSEFDNEMVEILRSKLNNKCDKEVKNYETRLKVLQALKIEPFKNARKK